jgi:two-component system alkaline phosphatase synthesis response regulator PhoP
MINSGIVLSRERFLETIWGMDASIETRTVDMHVRTLRAKLLEAGDYIKTVRSVGYELSPAEVE